MTTTEKLYPYALTTVQRVKDLLLDPSQTTNITGDLTSGSAAVANVSATSGLKVGQAISGNGIPANTTIAAIGTNSLTLSANATATAMTVPLSVINQSTAFDLILTRTINAATDFIESQCGGRRFALTTYTKEIYSVWGSKQKYLTLRQAPVFYLPTTLNITLGSTSATLPSANTGIAVGMPVWGDGIPTGCTVAAVNGTSLTLSSAATATNSAADILIIGLTKLEYRAGVVSAPNWTPFIQDQFELVDNGKAGLVRVYGIMPRIYNNMVRASYVAGYLIDFANAGDTTKHTLPGDLTRTCENIVVRWFKRREQAGKTSEAFQGTTITFNKELDSEDLTVIGKYQRAPVIF